MSLRSASMLALLGLLSAGPAVAGGATFHHDGLFEGPSVYGQEVSHGWNVYLAAGDAFVVTLEWFDPTADLDAFVVAPGGSCSVTDTACVANPNRVSCSDIPRGGPLGDFDGVESWTWVAASEGWHELFVGGAFVGPFDVPYHLTADIHGFGHTGWISRGRDVNFIPNQCRVLQSAPAP